MRIERLCCITFRKREVVLLGISVVVYETNNGLEIKEVSVFRMKDKYRLVKSRTTVLGGNDRSLVIGFNKSIKHNSNIPFKEKMSSEKLKL